MNYHLSKGDNFNDNKIIILIKLTTKKQLRFMYAIIKPIKIKRITNLVNFICHIHTGLARTVGIMRT